MKHLELIQAVITRLGNDGFYVKGWALTLAGAALGFAVAQSRWCLALVGLVPVVAFWGLDSYYLRAERQFRALYECVRRGDPKVPPFFMAAPASGFLSGLSDKESVPLAWRSVVFSPILRVFYLALVASIITVAVLVAST
ncbi:hypothetical protein HJD18_09845 [Thermoleophilia bacterium SCSIO 60948]|nr:hypothetical protein HJD18_09845 [Thermoleophilia bacterium SCSIO 60948]